MDIKKLLKATAFAANKHRDQRRKDADASPYINHPIALCDILVNEGDIANTDIICAAMLHDTIEDTDTTEEELIAAFGRKIAAIVMEVTDDKNLPKLERKRLQVEHAHSISHDAKLVKLADKIANLRDILNSPPQDWDEARKKEYFQWASDVVRGLRGSSAKLERVFDELFARI